MGQSSPHISHEDLMLTAMGESLRERSATVHAHLERCDECRSKLDAIRGAFGDFVETRRSVLDVHLPPAEPARASLQRRLAAARTAPWLEQLSWTPSLRWTTALAAIAIVLGGLALSRLGRPRDDVHARFVPDATLTPGLTVPLSRAQLCGSGAVQAPATLSRSVAREIFRLHGVSAPRPRAYELDYLIPPELGGASDMKNLWPQPYDAHPWSAYAKDALEDHLLNLVCEGSLDLATAQRALARDWTAAYQQYFRVEEPLVEHASFLKDRPWE